MNESGTPTLCVPRSIQKVRAVVSDVAAGLEQEVWTRLRGRLQSLQILRTHGGLVLRGQVPSFYIKQLVQHSVMSASTVPILANEIEVTRPMRGLALSRHECMAPSTIR